MPHYKSNMLISLLNTGAPAANENNATDEKTVAAPQQDDETPKQQDDETPKQADETPQQEDETSQQSDETSQQPDDHHDEEGEDENDDDNDDLGSPDRAQHVHTVRRQHREDALIGHGHQEKRLQERNTVNQGTPISILL